MQRFRNLARAEDCQDVQESLAQIAFVLNFLLPMLPAQRQNLG